LTVFDLFSKRQKRLRGDVPDVYVYDKIPQALRVQVVHIWRDALGNTDEYRQGYNGVYEGYKLIVDTLCREYGVFRLPPADAYGDQDYFAELANFLLGVPEAEKALDAIELSVRYIDRVTRRFEYLRRGNASEIADAAIAELNARFREQGVGFQYADGEIIRIDSEFVHAEVVKPALAILHERQFAGPQAEFLKAHEHYRHGNHKEALAECLKAFESVMKAICDKRKWKYGPQATSKVLIEVCLQEGLIPAFWQQHFSALRSLLETGIPTARNRLGGHGQGASIVEVPGYLVGYVLHMTAAAIVFLVEAERSKK
jgi:hypothetical protein